MSSGGFRIVSDTLVLYVSSSAVEKLPREIYGWGGALLVVSINVFCFIYTFITSAKGVGIVTTCVCVCLWAGLLQTWCYDWAYQSEVSIYFQWWSGPGYWSRSLFHFPHHCTIHLLIHILKWHFRKFVSISRTVSGCFLRTRRNDWCRQGNEFTTFWNTRIWNNVCDVRAAYSDGWTFQQYYFLRRLIASGLGHLVLKF